MFRSSLVRVLWVGGLLLLLGILGYSLTQDPMASKETTIGRQFPAVKLQDLDLIQQDSANVIYGQMRLVHFFASWCRTCQMEHAYIQNIGQHYPGLLIGVAYKDQRSETQAYLSKKGSPYVHVLSDPYGRLALDLGVKGTPESFLVNAKGRIVVHHIGLLDQSVWEQKFAKFISK